MICYKTRFLSSRDYEVRAKNFGTKTESAAK